MEAEVTKNRAFSRRMTRTGRSSAWLDQMQPRIRARIQPCRKIREELACWSHLFLSDCRSFPAHEQPLTGSDTRGTMHTQHTVRGVCSKGLTEARNIFLGC